MPASLPSPRLCSYVSDARDRLIHLVDDLREEQLRIPRLATVNPLLWEVGHIAWFQEKWILRHALGRPPLRPDADRLYDSATVPHDTRWSLPLPDRRGTLAYLCEVRDAVLDQLQRQEPDERLTYFTLLSVFHEDMHAEAFLMTRQTLGYQAPAFVLHPPRAASFPPAGAGPTGQVEIPAGRYRIGARGDEPFVFDNEKWAHEVELPSFRIDRHAVTAGQFQEFVADHGYARPEFWSAEGWRWREEARAEHPLYWRRDEDGWKSRWFDEWRPLAALNPVAHVNAHEAEAYCRWAGRRLPTEAEWEVAASWDGSGGLRRFPWGDEPADEQANLDARCGGPLPVTALAAADTATGIRQMLGNVWEWTGSAFERYPGFSEDPYREYSSPWFGDHRVLRGGGWATRSRMVSNRFRNFYLPHRRDVFAGFRTCEPGETGRA